MAVCDLYHLLLLADVVSGDRDSSYSVSLELVAAEEVPVASVVLLAPLPLSNAHSRTERDVRTFPRARWDLVGGQSRGDPASKLVAWLVSI